MNAVHTTVGAPRARPLLTGVGVTLLVVGLLGHLFSARAIGGSYVAYRDHIFGFVVLTIVSGVVLAGLGWRFWRGRHDITLLALGMIQAILGLVIWLNRFNIH